MAGEVRVYGEVIGLAVIDAQVGYDMVHSHCPLLLSSYTPSLSLLTYLLFHPHSLFSHFLFHLLPFYMYFTAPNHVLL
jgi:hypothetical protein